MNLHKLAFVSLAAGALLTLRPFAHAGPKSLDSNTATNEEGKVSKVDGFYCNMKAMTKAERERHKQLTEKLMRGRLEIKELPNGYAFRLSEEAATLAEVAEWVSAERKCCPFFDFEIEAQRSNGPLWLRLRGSEGVKVFIRAEFELH